MTSQLSRRLFRCWNIPSHLKYLPYYLDTSWEVSDMVRIDSKTGERTFNKPLVRWGNRRHMILFYSLNIFTIFSEVVFILVGIWYDQTRELRLDIRLIFYLFAITTSFFIFLQLVAMLAGKKVAVMHETWNRFNLRLHMLHGLKQHDRDGTEIVCEIMLLTIAGLVLCFPFGTMALGANSFGAFLDSGLVHHAVNCFCDNGTDFSVQWFEACPSFGPGAQSILGSIDKGFRAFGTVFTPIGSAYQVLGGLLSIYHYASGSMLYCVGMYRCLTLSTFTPGQPVSAAKKYVLYVFYKAHQILHEFMTRQASQLILLSIVLAAGILISALVAIIGFSKTMHPWLVIMACGASMMTLLITEVLFKMANIITDTSLNFKESFLRNDFSLLPVERRRLKACQSLQVWAGSIFRVDRHTYITFVNDVVLDNVINLVIDLKSNA